MAALVSGYFMPPKKKKIRVSTSTLHGFRSRVNVTQKSTGIFLRIRLRLEVLQRFRLVCKRNFRAFPPKVAQFPTLVNSHFPSQG